jgi:hypothetical protein
MTSVTLLAPQVTLSERLQTESHNFVQLEPVPCYLTPVRLRSDSVLLRCLPFNIMYTFSISLSVFTYPASSVISLTILISPGEEKGIRHYSDSADPSVHAVWGVGLRPLGCWGRGFDSLLGHGCLSVVLSCVGRGLCDGLITRPEESYRVSVCVWSRNPEREAKGRLWTISACEWMNSDCLWAGRPWFNPSCR